MTAHCPGCKTEYDKVHLTSHDASLIVRSQNAVQNNVFQTLSDEQRIHTDILTIKTQPKHFCTYYLVQFVGADVPKEMKAEGGFVLRGLAASTWF